MPMCTRGQEGKVEPLGPLRAPLAADATAYAHVSSPRRASPALRRRMRGPELRHVLTHLVRLGKG
jgi:hypothetical protein